MSNRQLTRNLVFELQQVKDKMEKVRSNNDYIYSNIFRGIVDEYNKCINKYNKSLNIPMELFVINDWYYSSTGKTVKEFAVEYFLTTISNLIDMFESQIEEEKRNKKEKEIPFYQMRRCFKIGKEGCPQNPKLERNKIFIGMPFNNKLEDSYQYGIIPALEAAGFTYFRADKNISNTDVMCQVCTELQTSRIAIFNITDFNPNVMLELGLAYGIGKPAIIVKDETTDNISDLSGIEYIKYAHAYDLREKLTKAIDDIVEKTK